jgi:hypothetical protein
MKEDNNYFKNTSQPYLPDKIKHLLIAEAPPDKKENFFYYTGEKKGNYKFFQNITMAIYDIDFKGEHNLKKELLEKFKSDGFFLIDSIGYPFGKDTTDDDKKKRILDEFKNLINRIKKFNIDGVLDKNSKIILMEKLVYKILEDRINNNQEIIFDKNQGVFCIPFPRQGCVDELFIKRLRKILNINLNKPEIEYSSQYKELKNKYEALKEELSKLISEKDHLEGTVKKNLEALYMVKIGKNEIELFKTECEVRRLKRKIELIQAEINHGNPVDLSAVEQTLNTEYKRWEKQVDELISNLEKSKLRLKSLLNAEQTKEIQNLYRTLVKRLHPDINPKQSNKEQILWFRTIDAYNNGDIEELKTIKVLVDDLEKIETSEDPITVLKDRIEKIKEKIYKQMEYIKELKADFPLNIQNNIDDTKWVSSKNKEILDKIEQFCIQKNELSKIIDDLIFGIIKLNLPEA